MTAAGSSEARPPLHHTINTNGHPKPRHVWVTVSGVLTEQHPGVLLSWRRDTNGGWEALVVWGFGGGRTAAHARIDWLAANHVTPR